MLSVDLRPGDSFLFPPPIQFFDVTYRQQYLPFGDDHWLPADFRSELDLKVGFRGILDFPVFRISAILDRLARTPLLTEYGWKLAIRHSSMIAATVLPDPTGPMMPRTNLVDAWNRAPVGEAL